MLGHSSSVSYGTNGAITESTNPLGMTTSITYDAVGRTRTVTNPLGSVTTFTYDANGNRTNVKDAKNHNWAATFDANGNLLTQKDPLNRVTTFTYDAANRLSTEKDPWCRHLLCVRWCRAPDGYRLPERHRCRSNLGCRESARLSERWCGHRDPIPMAGVQLTYTDGLGRSVSCTYDAAGRMTSRTQPGRRPSSRSTRPVA